jgi:hypothetical protein
MLEGMDGELSGVVTLDLRPSSGHVTVGFQNGGMGSGFDCEGRHQFIGGYRRARSVPEGGRSRGFHRSAPQLRRDCVRRNLAGQVAGRPGDASRLAPLLIGLFNLHRFASPKGIAR